MMLFENLVLRLLIEILNRMRISNYACKDDEIVKKAWKYIESQTVEKEYDKL